MRFLIDAQLPPALARYLSESGHDACHVADVGLLAANDAAIWAYLHASDYVVVSKDEDFARRRKSVASGPAVVWVRLPNRTRTGTIAWFESILPDMVANLARGEPLVVVF